MSDAVYLVVLGSGAFEAEIVDDGFSVNLESAKKRAVEVKQCKPDKTVRIFKSFATAEIDVRFDGESSL